MFKPARILALVVAAALPLLAGCAEDPYDMQEAKYPPPVPPAVGYDHSPPPPPVGATAAAQPMSPQSVRAIPPPPGQQVIPPGEITVDDGTGAEAGYGPEDQYADTDPSALTDFRSTLDPYGQWTEDPTYGTVWVPSQDVVGSDFTPYVSAGHWTYDDDYTWVSDYDWGWAPFHYGRWVYSTPYGWGWIPGRRYAGAWVSWRYGYGDWAYVGWGPLAPTWGWRGGMAYGLGFTPRVAYGFVGCGDLFAGGGLREHMVAGGQLGAVASHSRPYIGASPSVNGRIGATPRVNGPPPSVLGIPSSGIAHGGTTNRGVMQARAFAHASTATAMGAHAPSAVASRAGGMGAYGRAEPSHFGGRLGAGFRGSALNVRPGYGYSSSSMGAHPYYGASPASRGFGGGAYGGGYGGYRGGGYAGAAHPTTAPSGGHHYYSDEGSSGGFHSGGSHGGGGFRGGGGGGRGGGGRR
jgi:hypothetical protein